MQLTTCTPRSVQRGGVIHIRNAAPSFSQTLSTTLNRIPVVISKKLDELLSEYDWTPYEAEGTPSPYLSTLFQWLTTVVDSLAVQTVHKEKAYEGALAFINRYFLVSVLRVPFADPKIIPLLVSRTC